ncbi:MarR family winged helix-turn-helix transcriptional regulator [Fodinicola acaciae]|uniref:MarR family winged helix-turn-helix transcriptional regulator n=1 Tax=Fodinicola acaciae TaxID=2681555 RepID=UPI0013D024F5|nr:MarR family transcriptional regulator [Fodinicola acaciae]
MSVRARVEVWRSLLQVYVAVSEELAAALEARHSLSLSEFDALVNMPSEPIRINGLKERMILSQSAVSRLCDRLERRGLLEKIPCEGDLRGVQVALTPAGKRLRSQAIRTNAQVIDEHFASLLTREQLTAVGDALAEIKRQKKID